MALPHRFGGPWTEEKLNRLKKYLDAYLKIFTKNPRASTLCTTYVDAFAGTGYRSDETSDADNILNLFKDNDVVSYQKGSAYIALDRDPDFHKYLFIDFNSEHTKELEKLRDEFPQKRDKIIIIEEESNIYLQRWCRNIDWSSNRAVIFLDPYGMEVEWSTLQAIAKTKAIDLWLLFPLGQAVNRLLTRNSPPEGAWAERLTKLFGTDDWKEAFYAKSKQISLLQEDSGFVKIADFQSIGKYFVNRLSNIFPKVADNPLPLYNSKNVPIYLLCFAASNPKGATTALKIARHILRS